MNSKDLAWYAPFDPGRWWREFEAGREGYLVPVATNAYSTLYRVTNGPVTTADAP